MCHPKGVVIRVAAVSIEGGDTLNRWQGALTSKPHIVGYQAGGEIVEVGAEKEFDHTVAVGCSRQTQLARLRMKGLDKGRAEARIRSQLPVQEKMDRAQYVIWNDGSRAVLARQAEMIWHKINPARSGIKES